MENDIRPLKTPEERKEALEQALKRVRPQVLGHNDSVNGRLEKFANRTVDEHLKDENHKKKELKPMSLAEMAKYGTDLEKKAEKAGIELGKPGLSKDIEEKQKARTEQNGQDEGCLSRRGCPPALSAVRGFIALFPCALHIQSRVIGNDGGEKENENIFRSPGSIEKIAGSKQQHPAPFSGNSPV